MRAHRWVDAKLFPEGVLRDDFGAHDLREDLSRENVMYPMRHGTNPHRIVYPMRHDLRSAKGQTRRRRPDAEGTLRVQELRGTQHSSCTYGVGGRKCNGRTGIEAALVCSTSLRVRGKCCVSRERGLRGVPYPRSFEGRGQGCTISGAVGTAGRPPTEYRRKVINTCCPSDSLPCHNPTPTKPYVVAS